jgi:hypothetical protein
LLLLLLLLSEDISCDGGVVVAKELSLVLSCVDCVGFANEKTSFAVAAQ